MGFPRQDYWSGLPFPSLEDLPHQGSNLHLLCLLHWQADSLSTDAITKPQKGDVTRRPEFANSIMLECFVQLCHLSNQKINIFLLLKHL